MKDFRGEQFEVQTETDPVLTPQSNNQQHGQFLICMHESGVHPLPNRNYLGCSGRLRALDFVERKSSKLCSPTCVPFSLSFSLSHPLLVHHYFTRTSHKRQSSIDNASHSYAKKCHTRPLRLPCDGSAHHTTALRPF